MNDKPHLTLVDPNSTHPEHDEEFSPLPYYPWKERPPTLPLSQEEAATALHLSHGSVPLAAQILKTPLFRLARLIRGSPRLQRIQSENFELVLLRAVSIPIETLFNDKADQRALEWASTKVIQSRLAQGSPFSPAPAASTQSNATLTANAQTKTITFRWRTDADDAPETP